MRTAPVILYAALAACLSSCTKETSIEGDGNRGPALGANCRPSQVILQDTATRTGLFSFLTRFGTNGLATSVELYDSVGGTSIADIPLDHSANALNTPDGDFLFDATGRVKSFSTTETVNGIVQSIRYDYSYDANGFLSKKELFSSLIPLNTPLIRFTYAWAGQNLTAIEGRVVVPGLERMVFKSALEYDEAQTVKNFVHVLPDAIEASLYIMSLDFGKRSRNLLKRIKASTYDDAGALAETFTTEFSKPYFSLDGYLLEWSVGGDEPAGLPFLVGRNAFRYSCR